MQCVQASVPWGPDGANAVAVEKGRIGGCGVGRDHRQAQRVMRDTCVVPSQGHTQPASVVVGVLSF